MDDNTPAFKIMSSFFSAKQLAGKTLYARKPLIRIDYKGSGAVNVAIPKGGIVGVFYSWANLNNQLYLTTQGTYPFQNFVLYDSTSFSLSALEAQGALTVEEEAAAKEDASKTQFEKFLESLGLNSIGKTIQWAIPLGIFAYIGVKLYAEKNKADQYKRIPQNTNG